MLLNQWGNANIQISSSVEIWENDLLILACLFGFFGQDCAEKCNDKCAGCNNVNSLCDWGCNPGWKGDNCQQRN